MFESHTGQPRFLRCSGRLCRSIVRGVKSVLPIVVPQGQPLFSCWECSGRISAESGTLSRPDQRQEYPRRAREANQHTQDIEIYVNTARAYHMPPAPCPPPSLRGPSLFPAL